MREDQIVVDRIALEDQEGQTMVEFAFVLSLITIAIVTLVSLLSDAVVDMFELAVDSFG